MLRDRPELGAERLARTRRLMESAIMDARVTGYEPLIPAISLPDPDDRHVLAAAIRAGADAIVTFNLKDFPADMLQSFGIEAQHLDAFLLNQLGLDEAKVVVAAQACRARLLKPPVTAHDYLTTLERQSLPLTAAELRAYVAVI